MSTSEHHSWAGFLPKKAIVMARARNYTPVVESTPPLTEALSVNVALPEAPQPIQTPQTEPKMTASALLGQISQELQQGPRGCVSCKLCQQRKKIVVGEGNPNARLVFVGEGPGEQEDLQGRPFVGKAGQLLDRMIEAMGLTREQVYIANVVKCRPPGNRNPEPDEIQACGPYLQRQLDAIQPEVVVALGKFAAQTLLKTDEKISSLRGNFRPYGGAQLMPTFHPSYLLRNPASKREAWEDLKKVAAALKIEIPRKNK